VLLGDLRFLSEEPIVDRHHPEIQMIIANGISSVLIAFVRPRISIPLLSYGFFADNAF